MPALASILIGLLALRSGGPPPPERVIVEFDGEPDETWSASGAWKIERDARLVRSGTGSIRVTCAPPDKWPGVRVHAAALHQPGWRGLACDVFNASEQELTLWLRLDDRESRGVEANLARLTRPLKPGWNDIRVDLLDVKTTDGTRRLDGNALEGVVLYLTSPAAAVDLVFDHLRYVEPLANGGDDKAVLRALDSRWEAASFAERRGLVRALGAADEVERCRVLHHRLLKATEDSRLIDEAVLVLGGTQSDVGVKEACTLAQKVELDARWRWFDALSRMPSSLARKFLLDQAGNAKSGPDQTVAIRCISRQIGTPLIPLLGKELPGAWQVRAARVEALRHITIGDAFPTLVGYLKDEAARVRHDAADALVALSGRDLGDDAGAWLDWWKVNQEKVGATQTGAAGRRGGYGGTYYGVPLNGGRVGFIIDLSGSMRLPLRPAAVEYVKRTPYLKAREGIKTRLDLAKEELAHAIEGLPADTYFQIILFSTGVRTWEKQEPARATVDAKQNAIRKVRSLETEGTTNLYGGLVEAFWPKSEPTFRTVWRDSLDTLFVLTDGAPSSGDIIEPAHLVSDVRDRNRSRLIRINTIGLGDPNVGLLRDLARVTGGQYVDLAR